MTVDAFAVRMVRLEGAYEQIDKRLGSLEGRMASLERKVDETLARLRQDLTQAIDRVGQKLDATFRWVIGIVLVNSITLMLAIFLRR